MSADSEETPGMQERMAGAISDAMVDGELVLKYVCIAEVIDSDGDRALWAVASEESNSWDTLGLLHWALAREQANAQLRMVAELQYEDDDDE